MPISADLVQILCCPETKTPVEMLGPERLATLNAAIAEGKVAYADGSTVERPLQEALATVDARTVYRIDDGIPVMLADRAIPTAQIAGW